MNSRPREPLRFFAMSDLIDILDGCCAGLPRGYCSVDYLIRRVREDRRLPATVGDAEVRAAIVIAVEKGYLEYRNEGLSSTDGSPWIGSTQSRAMRAERAPRYGSGVDDE